ncbi:MAG TPA: M15 family metallopeptidase [Gemmatimonadales bacterium]|nr:M15 family metallopeptidase [Gemmatimonadales bacterium]
MIGAYLSGRDTVYVYEDGGALFARTGQDSVGRPLTGATDTAFRHWSRLQMGPAEGGGGQLRLQPVRPVAELLSADRSLTPPAESGAFIAPDLVEPARLDSTIRLEIRYATTNNFLSSVFYSSAHAFLQRPAAQALVRASRALRALGYGLLIHDAYRPWYVTKVFWDATPAASRWLVADPSKGSKHNRGAAVDITLYDRATGKPIEMPSTYDEATPRAYADFLGGTSLQRWHRALLRRALETQGFTVNPSEWWHFDFHGWEKYPILDVPFEELLQAAGQDTTRYTHADTLRGSNGPGRAWWDVQFYDLHTRVNPADSSITGWDRITYKVLQPPPAIGMQIDLQVPLEVDSIVQDRRKLRYTRDGNAFFVRLAAQQRAGEQRTITVWYHGKPHIGRRLPWDGGFSFTQDSLGHRWIATANEGVGASIWWPNKDYLGDEPDSQRIAITVPDSMIDVSNGRLRAMSKNRDGTATYEWFVSDPINNYDVTINAGHYTHFSDTLAGEAGKLTLDFWPLAYHADTARGQFKQVTSMLKCFEYWFGPYPWYADGYKLVETPHLGMEHQSAIAYGNHFLNGYLGRDLSRTGIGLTWDFIIVHESAHEWWGNNISAQDHADMWLHESFANYAEGIYSECRLGKAAGAAYMIGARSGVRNDRPIIPAYGVNAQGSGDMYSKGGNMLHTIRAIIDDDAKWRDILRGLNQHFRHQTVTGKQVEDFISQQSGIDLSKVFSQYLTTTKIPVFEYRIEGSTLSYRWSDVVPGFDMPVRVNVPGLGTRLLRPTESWQTLAISPGAGELTVDENFYVTARNLGAANAPAPGR